MDQIFEWKRMLLNGLEWASLLEIAFRSAVMFVIILVGLRIAGKRGVKRLSIFETVIIIALGSAAGDPMFYNTTGLLPALVVFTCVIFLYRTVTWLMGKSKRFETVIEGQPIRLVQDGEFCLRRFEKEPIVRNEFYAELRLHYVEHLGQVRRAYIEHSGEISVFFYSDNDVIPGLPILPEFQQKKSSSIHESGDYACAFCGAVSLLHAGQSTCRKCGSDEWIQAMITLRQC